MPIYKCPKCGRTVHMPKGNYYCRVCGPTSLMVLEHSSSKYPTLEGKVACSRDYIKSYVERAVGDIFGDNVERFEFTGSFAGKSWKPFRPESDVDVIVWLKDARKGSRDLSTVERTNPKLLNVCSHKIHFLIYPSILTYSAMTTTHSSNPQTVEVKPKLSLSGLCHTLTLDEYDVLYDLDYFYRLSPGQYASLIWLARKYQDRHEEKYGRRTYVLKECIDEIRRILERLWRKGMVQPEAITVKTYDRVVLVT